ncbi:Protein HEG 1, partial [Lamprotornis superbus]
MLAGSREWSQLPARHRAVPAASRVTGHTGPPASDGDVTPPGAGSPEHPSAGTVTHLLTHSHPPDPGNHHHAAGRQGRAKRALASPNTPAAAEGTAPGSEAIGTNLAEGTQGGHHGVWNVSGFNHTVRTVLPPSSSESHHPGEPSQFSPGTLGKCSNTWEQGTDSLSQPMSSWVGMELGSSPAMGTAAASPSPLGSSPSTALPVPLGQPQASSQASSTQTGAEHSMLHPRAVTGNSTSPLLTASPPTDNTFIAIGSSHQPSNNSATERFSLDFPTTSTSISTTATKGGGRTLRSLSASTRLITMAEISTSGTEIPRSSAQSQTPGMPVGARDDGGRTFSSNYELKSIPGAEEVTLHLDIQDADLSSMAVGTLMSPENGHTAEVTRDSATSTNPTSSLGGVSSSLTTGTHHPNSSQEATDLPGPPGGPLLTSSLSASEGPFRGVRSSHSPVAEKTSPSSSATSTLVSAMSSSGGRLPWSASGSSHWTAAKGFTSSRATYRTLGTTQSLPTSSVRDTSRAQGSTGMTDFTKVADSSLTHSHSPSEGPSPATGSSHVSFSILSTERRNNFPTTSTSVSTTGTKGGGRTLRSLPASTILAKTTEISTTGTENISSPGHSQSSLGTQGGGGRGATLSSMNTLLTDSPSSSESTSPDVTSAMGGRLPLTSTPSVVTTTVSEESSTVPVLDTRASVTGSSSSSSSHTSTLDTVLLSSSAAEPGEQSHVSQSSAGLSELPTKLLPAFSPSVSVPSPSATLFVRKEGTSSQAPDSHSTWSTKAESLTSHLDTHEDIQTGPVPSSTAWPRVTHVSSGQAGSPEPKVTLSSRVFTYFSAAASTIGSSHHSLSSSSAEKSMSSPVTDPVYGSATPVDAEEGMLHSVTDGTLASGIESSSFHAEASSSPGLSEPALVGQGRTANASTSSGAFMGFATETVSVRSAKIPTYSSFQNDLTKSPEPHSPSVVASSPALSSSLPTSSLPSPSYSLASLLSVFSSPSSISQSSESDQASATVATSVVRQVPSTAATARSSPRETNRPNVTHQPQKSTTFTPTRSPLPTAPMELLGGRVVSASAPVTVTETASPGDATTQGHSFGKATPLLTTASIAPQAGPTDAPLSPSASTANHSSTVPAVAVTTVKPPVLTMPAGRQPTPGEASTIKDHRTHTPTATKHSHTTGKSTEAMDLTTAKPGKVTEENIPVTSPSEAPSTTKTTASITTTLAATKPTTVPPSSSTVGLRTSPPATEVDKCLSNPCPALATCNNTHGSYICQCPLGYELEKGKCNLVRIFIGQVPLKLNITHGKYTELFHVEREILEMLNASLSSLPGYHHSTVKASREANVVHVSVQSTFSLASNVTFFDVISSVKSYIRACKSPTEACQFISSLKSLHRAGSLCRQKDPECDKETSECTDFNGVALCQCKSGYFKYNKMDHSCRACEDGYKLENETCVRKNKNDISKLIFKSGDFQMSPYAEYPKNPRAQEWGRETIEMQENGSTKNLLQMTDVYYSPTGLRNPELERNGLYPPYTGLPGSRHSCIYPGQYNPSFIISSESDQASFLT